MDALAAVFKVGDGYVGPLHGQLLARTSDSVASTYYTSKKRKTETGG